MTAPFGEQPTRADWLREWGELHAEFAEADAVLQEWDWPRACPWCGVTVPVGVPSVLVDGEFVCQECAL